MQGTKKKANPRAATAIDAYKAARIRAERNAAGLTQTDLAEKLNVSFQQVQKYEGGTNRVSAARLFAICKALNVSLASMFEHDPTS